MKNRFTIIFLVIALISSLTNFNPVFAREKLYVYYDFNSSAEFSFTASGDCAAEIYRESEDNSVLRIKRTETGEDTSCSFVFPPEMYSLNKFVVQFDIKLISNTGIISMFEIVDNVGVLTSAVSIVGENFYLGGQSVCKISAGRTYNIAICYDNDNNKYSAYVNEDLKKTCSLPYGAAHPLRGRTRAVKDIGKSEYYIDNLYAYSGTMPMTFRETEKKEAAGYSYIGETTEDAIALLGTAAAFLTSNDTMYVKGQKLYYGDFGVAPYIDGQCLMLPEKFFTMAFDIEFSVSGTDIFLNGTRYMTLGSLEIDRTQELLTAAPRIIDSVLYLPFEDVCTKILNLYTYYDERGMYIADYTEWQYKNSEINAELSEPIDVIYRFLQFDRPSGDEIYNKFCEHTNKGEHPRLITTSSEVSKIKTYILNSVEFEKYYRNTLINANKYLSAAPLTQVFDGNNGTSFLNSARMAMSRIRCLGIAYTFSGEEKYAVRCFAEIENLIDNWTNWNGDSYYLLDTSETVYGIVMGYDFLYDWLSESQKEKIINCVFDRHLNYISNAYKGKHVRLDWITTPNTNWGFVVNGGVIAACMALADEVEGERLETIKFALECAVKSLEVQMMSFYPDGAWAEGPGYWQYAVMYLFGACLAPLKFGCGTTFDLLDVPGADETLNSIIQTQGPSGVGFEYGDCSPGYGERDAIGFLIAGITEDETAMASWRKFLDSVGASDDERTLLWYKPEMCGDSKNLPTDRFFIVAE